MYLKVGSHSHKILPSNWHISYNFNWFSVVNFPTSGYGSSEEAVLNQGLSICTTLRSE